MPKDVRILVRGLQSDIPADRIAYLVHQIAGRAQSVEVESVEEVDPPAAAETGEQKVRRQLQRGAALRERDKGLPEEE